MSSLDQGRQSIAHAYNEFVRLTRPGRLRVRRGGTSKNRAVSGDMGMLLAQRYAQGQQGISSHLHEDSTYSDNEAFLVVFV